VNPGRNKIFTYATKIIKDDNDYNGAKEGGDIAGYSSNSPVCHLHYTMCARVAQQDHPTEPSKDVSYLHYGYLSCSIWEK